MDLHQIIIEVAVCENVVIVGLIFCDWVDWEDPFFRVIEIEELLFEAGKLVSAPAVSG